MKLRSSTFINWDEQLKRPARQRDGEKGSIKREGQGEEEEEGEREKERVSAILATVL